MIGFENFPQLCLGVTVLICTLFNLYKMKRKSQSLQLKVAVDDKVSYYFCLNPFFYYFSGGFLRGLEIECENVF